MRILIATLLVAGLAACAEKPKPNTAAAPPAPAAAAPLPAQPARMCAKPAEKQAFDVAGLKSQLMVTAISCQHEERYNSFVGKYRGQLQASEKALNGYFSRSFGRTATQEHDNYITALANAESQDGLKHGTDFCQKNMAMFDEVMALKDGTQLAQYSESKSLFQPLIVSECPAAPPPPPKKKTTK